MLNCSPPHIMSYGILWDCADTFMVLFIACRPQKLVYRNEEVSRHTNGRLCHTIVRWWVFDVTCSLGLCFTFKVTQTVLTARNMDQDNDRYTYSAVCSPSACLSNLNRLGAQLTKPDESDVMFYCRATFNKNKHSTNIIGLCKLLDVWLVTKLYIHLNIKAFNDIDHLRNVNLGIHFIFQTFAYASRSCPLEM